MIRISILLLLGLFFLQMQAMAAEPYEADCTKECSFLTKDCTAYVECRVAKTTCLESCMQRKVWEKVATAVDKLTVTLEKQAQREEEKEKTRPEEPIVSATPAQIQNTTLRSSASPDSMDPYPHE